MDRKADSAWNRIRVLGICELVAFVAIAFSVNHQETVGGGWKTISGIGVGGPFLQTYLAAGLPLIPSAIIFILAPKQKKVGRLKVARILQLILFIAVCLAFVPSAVIAQYGPQLLVACILGVVFFPFMMIFVGKLLKNKGDK